jgi:hypothetical protein
MNNNIRKLEIQSAPVFQLEDYEFYDKLGEGKNQTIIIIMIGAFGRVRLARKVDSITKISEENPEVRE